MSYTSDIKDYFRTVSATADSDLVEWTGIFNLDNIPRNIKNKSYNLKITRVNSDSLNDLNILDNTEVTYTLFMRALRDCTSVRDSAIDLGHGVRVEAVKPINAMVGTNIKNVILNSMEIEEIDGDDNSIVLTMNFTVSLIF